MIGWLATRIARVPPAAWMTAALVAALFIWHALELRQARQQARAELKADIATEAQRLGRSADAATNRVLACKGSWNRSKGLCEP